MSKIKAITFDATGTLFKVRGSIAINYSKVFSQHGIQLNQDIDSKFLKCFSELSKKYPSYGHSVSTDNDEKYKMINRHGEKNGFLWWNHLMKTLLQQSSNLTNEEIDNIPTSTYKDMYNKFSSDSNSSIGSHEFWELFPETKQVLGELKKQGYILSVISNFDERIYPILKQLDIINYFSTITTSIDVGYQKPHPEIFNRSWEKLLTIDPSLVKSQVIYVGDSIEKDCIGSSNFGFIPCLINRKPDTPNNPKNFKIIKNLNELLPLYQGK